MLSIVHTLSALPFGVWFNNPLLAFIAAFIFHLFADTLLHWNIFPEKFPRYPYGLIALDVVGGVFVSWLILHDAFFTLPMLAAIAGSNAPDVLQALWEMIPRERREKFPPAFNAFFRFHDKLQHETYDAGYGLIAQAILVVLAIIVIAIN